MQPPGPLGSIGAKALQLFGLCLFGFALARISSSFTTALICSVVSRSSDVGVFGILGPGKLRRNCEIDKPEHREKQCKLGNQARQRDILTSVSKREKSNRGRVTAL